MKLAILQNPDVIEKNQYRIRIQRPKISKDLLVSSNAQKKVKFYCPVLQNLILFLAVNLCNIAGLTVSENRNPIRSLNLPILQNFGVTY